MRGGRRSSCGFGCRSAPRLALPPPPARTPRGCRARSLFFFKPKTAYELPKYWSSDVCSSDLETANETEKSTRDSADATSLVKARQRLARSEERRVGKECRSRWKPYN